MTYDADKTPKILDELRDAVASVDYADAIRLLRHADAGGAMRADPGLLRDLHAAIGKTHAAGILSALATDPCRYCAGGRERCAECRGKGLLKGSVCSECAGLGVVRCPFCNGTALAGYDFVPRGLRPAVVAHRLALAERRLADLGADPSPTDAAALSLARRIVDIDRCRGMLANTMEQVRLHRAAAPGARPAYSAAERARIERACRSANEQAESALRRTLTALADVYSAGSSAPSRPMPAALSTPTAPRPSLASAAPSASRTPPSRPRAPSATPRATDADQRPRRSRSGSRAPADAAVNRRRAHRHHEAPSRTPLSVRVQVAAGHAESWRTCRHRMAPREWTATPIDDAHIIISDLVQRRQKRFLASVRPAA